MSWDLGNYIHAFSLTSYDFRVMKVVYYCSYSSSFSNRSGDKVLIQVLTRLILLRVPRQSKLVRHCHLLRHQTITMKTPSICTLELCMCDEISSILWSSFHPESQTWPLFTLSWDNLFFLQSSKGQRKNHCSTPHLEIEIVCQGWVTYLGPDVGF